MRYLEDLTAGQEIALGSHTVALEEITDFATAWDPQRFHLDAEAAAATPFGGIVASGWHTASIFMRLCVDGLLADSSCVGGSGADELRWTAPVRPGDVLTGRVVVEQVVPSRRPGRGTAHLRCELHDAHGALVFTMLLKSMFASRPV